MFLAFLTSIYNFILPLMVAKINTKKRNTSAINKQTNQISTIFNIADFTIAVNKAISPISKPKVLQNLSQSVHYKSL